MAARRRSGLLLPPLSSEVEQRLVESVASCGSGGQAPADYCAILGSASGLDVPGGFAGLRARARVRLEPGGGGSSGGGGRMSAEAADREAATSSRPCTPPQTCWFEFLLEESLLEKHLRKACPGERAGVVRGRAALCAPLTEAWQARPGGARRCPSRERRRKGSEESFRQRPFGLQLSSQRRALTPAVPGAGSSVSHGPGGLIS